MQPELTTNAIKDAILKNSQDCINIMDLDGKIQFMNRIGLKKSGLKALSEIEGKSWLDNWEGESKKSAFRTFENALSGTSGEFTGEIISENSRSYWSVVISPIFDESGSVIQILAVSRDVTALAKAQEDIKNSVDNERENFRNLFKQTPEMVCVLSGPEHTFEFVNEAHIKALGFDATGMTVRQAQPESVEVYDILDRVYQTGKTAELKEIAITLTDRLRYFDLTYSARRGQSGAINGIMILGIEVTEIVQSRKNVEESAAELERAVHDRTIELKESQAFLDSVIENIPNMVFVKDAKDLRFVRFNRAGEDLLGYPRSSLIGKNDFDFFPKNEADHFVAKDREVLAGKAILDIPEETIETKNRGQRILHTRKIPIFGIDGRPEYLLGISEDITEWKKAEAEKLKIIREQAAVEERKRENERATFLAEASTVLASSLDYHKTLKDLAEFAIPKLADWCTVTIVKDDNSKSRVAMVHCDPEKAQLIKELITYYPTNTNESTGVGQVIKTKKSLFAPMVDDCQIVAASKDNRHLEILRNLGCRSCMVVPIISRGQALGAISFVSGKEGFQYSENDLAVAEELGRRAGIAIENALLYKKSQDAISLRDEFLSIASHELKTPVTTMKFQLQMFERDGKKGSQEVISSPRIVDKFTMLNNQIRRLTNLLDDLLDVSRIQNKKLRFEFSEIDLCSTIQDLSKRFNDEAKAQGLRILVQSNCSIVGHWDRLRMEQIAANLISNAIKYGHNSDGGGETVDIFFEENSDTARLIVRDHGMGISPEDQQRVFDRFERTESARNYGGLGLGLYITKQLVEAHRGKIWVESEVNKGSRFIVELPKIPFPDAKSKITNQEEYHGPH